MGEASREPAGVAELTARLERGVFGADIADLFGRLAWLLVDSFFLGGCGWMREHCEIDDGVVIFFFGLLIVVEM